MSHKVYSVSSIARPLEPAYRSNLAIMILAPVIGLCAALAPIVIEGAPFSVLTFSFLALKGLLVAFLAWALGREADPDRVSTAFIALGLTAAILILGVDTGLWTIAFTLMATRIVNRTVGPAARFTDLVIVLILCALAVFRDGYALMGLVGALAFVLDAWFDRTRTLNIVFALVALGFTVATYVQTDFGLAEYTAGFRTISDFWIIIGGTGGAVGLMMAVSLPQLKSRCDAIDSPLQRGRVCCGMIVITAAWLAGSHAGEARWEGLIPILAVIFGAGIARLIPGGGAKAAG